MKKIIIIFSLIILLISCWNKEENQKIEPKKVLENHFKEETLKKLEKFDKNNTREKVESLTWFLCFNETLNHPWTNISIIAKNCKHEEKDDVVYFKVKWNSIFKALNETEEELIKIETKLEKLNIWTYINNNVIANYKNIVDRKYCEYRKVVKKDFLNEDDDKEVYSIEPVWFYKNESKKQLKKDPNSPICEWYYPDLNKFFIYDTNKPWYVLQIIRKDNLMDFNSIKFN